MGVIYKISNNINGKVYIGQTKRPVEIRWSGHKSCAFNPNSKEYNKHLYCSMRKYGLDNFSFEVIEECDNDILNDREKYWIKYYNAMDENYGYNILDGGTHGSKMSDKTIEEINQLWRNNHSIGSISSSVGLSHTTVLNVVRLYNDNYSLGESISRSKSSPVVQYDRDGNYIATYYSSKEAEEKTGVNRGLITDCCCGMNKTAGGFQWRRENDDPPGQFTYTPVVQYDLDGNKIAEYPSMKAAGEATGANPGSIADVCGYRKVTSGGFQWRHLGDDNVGKVKAGRNRPISQYDFDGCLIGTYSSISEASRKTNIAYDNIKTALQRTGVSCGFQWKDANDPPPPPYKRTSYKARCVLQFDLDGNFIQEYNSMTEAGKITGINYKGISACCLGKYKTYGGYIWKNKNAVA